MKRVTGTENYQIFFGNKDIKLLSLISKIKKLRHIIIGVYLSTEIQLADAVVLYATSKLT